MFKIAVEEAFVTENIKSEWRKILDDGAPGEAGFTELIGGFINPKGPWQQTVREQLPELGPVRLATRDAAGVDMQLIALTAPGVQVFNADTGGALAAEANDILAAAVSANPQRFQGLAAVAPQAPETAAKELERALGLGLKGILINSHTKGEYLDAYSYRPLLEAIESLDVPLYIHPRPVPPGMFQPFGERHFSDSFWGFQTDTALHALRLIVTGVFDEFPKLTVVIGHLGEGLPFWLDRLDRQYAGGGRSKEGKPHWQAKRLPSDYFRDNFYISSSGHNWDPAVRFVEEVVGEDRLMFAVDYPYADCVQQTAQAADINLKNADKFYHLNAMRVFDIDIPGVNGGVTSVQGAA